MMEVIDIHAELEKLKEGEVSLKKILDFRYKLTADINKYLYVNNLKEHGSQILKIRNSLDEFILNTNSVDMVDGNVEGLLEFKKGLKIENLSEQLKILEIAIENSKGSSKILQMQLCVIITDPDRYPRFEKKYQKMLAKAAFGISLLVSRRVNKVRASIGSEAYKVNTLHKTVLQTPSC